MVAPKGLKYFGGKQGVVGNWIASQLPYAEIYCEPFAGMLSVLLRRRPSVIEIANDLDDNVICWWRQVRDNHAALVGKLSKTPQSAKEYQDILDSDWESWDDLDRAWAYSVLMAYGFGGQHNYWNGSDRKFKPSNWPVKIEKLAARLIDVEIKRMDAVELLDYLAPKTNIVIYCDPPYHSASVSGYRHLVDVDAFVDVLGRCQGKVAVSGYPSDSYDVLGWNKVEMSRLSQLSRTAMVDEVLWCNFEPVQQRLV